MTPSAEHVRWYRSTALTIVGICGAVVLWTRFAILGQPFLDDEARTVMSFVNGGPHAILSGPFRPNNHPLFSLLSWATTGVLGRYEAAYRLPSVVPAIAAIVLIGWWVWHRLGRVACVSVVTLATVSSLELSLSVEARGYGLAFLAGAGMLVFADRASSTDRRAEVGKFLGFGLVGVWTLPTVVLPFVAHLAILLLRRALRKTVIVLAVVLGLITLVFYIPRVHETRSIIGNSLTSSAFGYGWMKAPFSHLAQPSLSALFPGSLRSDAFTAPLFVVLVGLGVFRLWRRHERTLLLHLVAPVIFTYLVFFAARAFVLQRAGSFLLFHVIVLLGIGVSELWVIVQRFASLRLATALVMTAAFVVGIGHVLDQTDTTAHPPRDLRAVGEIVRSINIERVLYDAPGGAPVIEYYADHVIQRKSAEQLRRMICTGRRPLVFVQHLHLTVPVERCLNQRDAKFVHLPQYLVWTVPAVTSPRPGS
jgi:hypothetical protein